MATPTIKIDQATQPAGTAGQSRDNLVLGQVVTLTDPANPGGTVWAWTMLSRPIGSSATLAGANTATATFTPDVEGTYLIRLNVDGFKSWTELVDNNLVLFHTSSTQGGCAVKYADGTRKAAPGETTEFPPGSPTAGGWHTALDDFITRTVSRVHLGIYSALRGSIPFVNASANLAALAPGTAGYLLQTNGAGADPTWVAPPSAYPTIQDEGTPVAGNPHSTLNFVGAGVAVTNGGGGVATITIAGGGSGWDGVYDFGGAGAGRSSTVDAGAWRALGNAADNNNVFEIEKKPAGAQSGHALDIQLNVNASGAGLKITHDGLATEQVHGLGLWLFNSTPAANGAQQVSPDLKLTGHAYKSDAVAASQQHDWVFRVFPTQGASVSTSAISIRHRIDAAAYATLFQINSSNQIVPTGLGTAALPVYTVGSATMGMYAESTSQLGWSVSGTQRMTLNASSLFLNFSGSQSTPAIRMNDTNSGLTGGADAIAVVIAGANASAWSSTAITHSLPVQPNTNEAHNLGTALLRWNTTYSRQFNSSEDVIVGTTLTAAQEITAGSGGTGGFTGKSLALTQAVSTSGNPTFISAIGAAHTGLTAGAETIDVNFNLSRSVQHATGAIATQRAFLIQAPTYSFVGASVITNAATFEIDRAPVAGTNATITNAWAMRIMSGASWFGGRMLVTTDGSNPAIAETTDPDTGIQWAGSNVLDIWCGGVARASFGTASATITPILNAIGGIRFNASDTTTKIYRDAANSIAMDISGTEYLRVRAAGARFQVATYTTEVVLTDGATVTPDVALSNNFTWTIGGNRTLANPSNVVQGMTWQVIVKQDGTGGRTITWGANYVGGNGVATSTIQPESGANRYTIFTFYALTTSKIAIFKSEYYV